jgi:hypothetical protein
VRVARVDKPKGEVKGMKAEAIRLAEGERIDVIKEAVGYSINGPAVVVVVKEKTAAENATADDSTLSTKGVHQIDRAG